MTKKTEKKLNKGYRSRGGVAVIALMGVVYFASQGAVFAQNAAPNPALAPVAAAAPVAIAPINPVPAGQPQATANVTPVGTPTPPDAPQQAVSANAAPVTPQIDDTVLLATADAKRNVRDGSLMADDNFPTLFFTAWQHALLQEAKIGFIGSRTGGGGGGAGTEQAKKDPGIREVSLGGIAFANAAKWTVWLNGVRVTPSAFPQQVLDIKVTQNYIDLKWFDDYTNRIYPIRLRPQERFNLDSRIFLPGAGVDKGAM